MLSTLSNVTFKKRTRCRSIKWSVKKNLKSLLTKYLSLQIVNTEQYDYWGSIPCLYLFVAEYTDIA